MPIKPENLKRYPANWKDIRTAILERAGNACEGSPAYPDCRAPNGWWRLKEDGALTGDEDLADEWIFNAEAGLVTRIVLTIAHLDHVPEHCEPENLRAWCQRCHLHYDLPMHMRNAFITRHERLGVPDMFGFGGLQ